MAVQIFTPSAHSARVFVTGQMFNQKGEVKHDHIISIHFPSFPVYLLFFTPATLLILQLLVSLVQEGLARKINQRKSAIKSKLWTMYPFYSFIFRILSYPYYINNSIIYVNLYFVLKMFFSYKPWILRYKDRIDFVIKDYEREIGGVWIPP